MRATRGHTFLLATLTFLLATVAALITPTPAHADEPPKVMLLLDVSGSMNERIASGGTKFAAAKRALKDVASSLPAGTDVGLRVYGSKIAEPKATNPKACTDSELVLPIGPLDKAKMYRAVDSFTAKGETPIAYSLGKAVDDLGDSGKRVLVLISDGEETCAKDPCPTARKLADSGVNLQFNAIGLAVGSKARKQLQCIADAGDGTYYDASRTGDLTQALRKITQRALRPFQVSGTPVKGTTDAAGAPSIQVGQYTDRYDSSAATRYYKITRTPGSTVTASIASITDPKNGQSGVGWRMALSTTDGTPCGDDSAYQGSLGAVSVVSGAVSSKTSSDTPGPCQTAPELVFGLSRTAGASELKRAPVEVVIAEEPEITNLAGLPPAVTGYNGDGKAVKATKPVRAVIGGSAFSNAPAVEAGSWSDAIAIGETVFYRTRVEPGQKVRVTAEAPWPRSSSTVIDGSALVQVSLYAPLRQQLTNKSSVFTRNGNVKVSATSPVVRVRNREAGSTSDARGADTGGDYYVAVQLSAPGPQLRGLVEPVRLSIAVDGTPSGQPEYANAAASTSPTPTSAPTATSPAPASPAPSASPSPASDRGGSPVLAVLAIGAAGLVAIGGALFLARRRGRGRP